MPEKQSTGDGGRHPATRPFLSYTTADRAFVEPVARQLAALGMVPIYDQWWLRTASASDVAESKAEIAMGVDHADAFVHFLSPRSTGSPFVAWECERALWRSCSDAPDLTLICVTVDDPDELVPHWFQHVIDARTGRTSPTDLAARLASLLKVRPPSPTPAAVQECRHLAGDENWPALRTMLEGSDRPARREAAILLALLERGARGNSSEAIVRELGLGLGEAHPERCILALGHLGAAAESAIAALSRFAAGTADPFARAMAVRALGRTGRSSGVMSALMELTTSGSGVRGAAMLELGLMGPSASPAVPRLAEIARTSPPEHRLSALSALARIGDTRREVLAAVLSALAVEEPRRMPGARLHRQAMITLNRLAPTDRDLAGAMAMAWHDSIQMAAWISAEFPDLSEQLTAGDSAAMTEEALLELARRVLQGCRLLG